MIGPLKPAVKMIIGLAMLVCFPLWVPLVLVAGVAWILGEAVHCLGEAVGLLERPPELAEEEL